MVETNFKQTDIGQIPEDWEVKELGEISQIIMGQSPLSENYNQIGVGLPLVQGNADIKNRKTIIRNYTSQITKRGLAGDIIMSVRAPVGEIAKVTFECCLGRGVCAIRAINDYLYHYLIFAENKWGQFSTGSTFDSVSSNQINEFSLAIPQAQSEQKAIAEVLNDTDHWITSLEDLIAKKQLIKQGAMQKLLTPKEDWEVKKLDEVGKTYGGLSGKTKVDFGRGNAHYIPFMNVMKNVIIDNSFFEKVNLKQGEIQNKVLKNDLLFNGSSETPEELGISSVILEDIDNLYLNSFCFGFRLFDSNVNPLFLSYLFRSPYGRKIIFYLAQGATRYNLSKANFLELEISFPKSVIQQNYIATILSDMDAEIETLEQKLTKAKQIKQGLMQKLLTGRIRLV